MSSPVKKRVQQDTKSNSAAISTAWQGPLPPPEAVQKFDHIVEGGAERIFRMAEKEQDHRIQTEASAFAVNQEATRAEIAASRRGAWMGFTVSMLAVSGALFTVYLGAHPTIPIALVSVPVMGAVRALVMRK